MYNIFSNGNALELL